MRANADPIWLDDPEPVLGPFGREYRNRTLQYAQHCRTAARILGTAKCFLEDGVTFPSRRAEI
jgi:hypothetical protein